MDTGKLPFLKTVGRLSFKLQTCFKKFYLKVLIIENKQHCFVMPFIKCYHLFCNQLKLAARMFWYVLIDRKWFSNPSKITYVLPHSWHPRIILLILYGLLIISEMLEERAKFTFSMGRSKNVIVNVLWSLINMYLDWVLTLMW